ncbi:MAG: aldehyde dehydrogenase family protein [Candidatus Parvarchaeota archaeon]|nr:aldehyde dehydrogenase family protein [Candidatus Parvarchaeota archaeon]MCW1301522.1 aldehyde dehydrogenase family protein [Candidatus Parvarchaeota archaeon]
MVDIKLSDKFSDIYIPGETKRFKIFIGGKWVETKDKFDLISPIDSRKMAEISSASKEDIDAAVKYAVESKHKIRDMPAIDRIELINKFRLELEKYKDEIVDVLMKEAGKARRSAEGEFNATIERMRLGMEDSRKITGEYIPGDWSSDTSQKVALVLREPLGVVLGISPFNYPFYTSMAKVIPALLSGNSVIIKPPSVDPIAFLMAAKVFQDVGAPDGIFQAVTGKGDVAGDYLTSNPNINMISFTGSTDVGKHIAGIAGLRKTHLELGGKGTAIVLEDADLDLAARECVKGSLELAGQRCDAVSRILAVDKIYDKFVEKLKQHLQDYKFGNPIESPDVTMGPVISKSAAKRIDDLVKDAVSKGAKLLAGGKYNDCYYEPTLLVDTPLNAKIVDEETFGPVITLIKVKDKADAINLANQSRYGLDSSVFTNKFYDAWEVMKALQVGNVTLNAAPSHGTAYFPFGGVKDSGSGKEGVGYSIDEMTYTKTIVFNLAPGNLGKRYTGQFKD